MLCSLLPPGVFDKEAPHGFGPGCKEVAATLKSGSALF
jgi:hypothetical protein